MATLFQSAARENDVYNGNHRFFKARVHAAAQIALFQAGPHRAAAATGPMTQREEPCCNQLPGPAQLELLYR
jgi:hypothetical protein